MHNGAPPYHSKPYLSPLPAGINPRPTLITIGVSAGGPDTLCKLLAQLKADLPPIMLVQHMPENFTTAFAERLNAVGKLTCVEATDNEVAERGKIYLAPGGKHLSCERKGGGFRTRVAYGELACGHRPAVEVLYQSVAASGVAKQTWAIILTGMGHDGATGMKALYDAGAHTIAQSEESCFIFGMPKMAIRAGGVREILSLEQIAERVNLI